MGSRTLTLTGSLAHSADPVRAAADTPFDELSLLREGVGALGRMVRAFRTPRVCVELLEETAEETGTRCR